MLLASQRVECRQARFEFGDAHVLRVGHVVGLGLAARAEPLGAAHVELVDILAPTAEVLQMGGWRRLVPGLDELGVGHATGQARLALGIAGGGGGLVIDRQRRRVELDLVQALGDARRDQPLLDVADDARRIALQQVAVTGAGTLRNHEQLAAFGNLEAHAHVVGGVARPFEGTFVHEFLDRVAEFFSGVSSSTSYTSTPLILASG
ncbi:hypothetical protein ACFS3C_05200 [Azotobacter vinelandii]